MAVALGGLALLLPFEPRVPLASLLGLRLSLLEAAALAASLVLLVAEGRRLPRLLGRPPLPLVGLALYAVAQGLSALLAAQYRGAAARFALRMAAMAVFACLVALAPPRARRAFLLGLVVAGGAVAALALAEAGGVHTLDPFLDLFREMRFNVAGAVRVTGGTAYPTLAAVWIGAGLLALVGSLLRARPLLPALLGSLVAAPALLATYSRGAMAAAGAALLVLAWAARRAVSRRAALAALCAFAVLAAGALLQAARREIARLRLTAENARAWYGAAYQPAAAALELRPGERRTTEVWVRNAGTLPWTAAGGFSLSYHWFEPGKSPLQDGARTPLAADLGPGGIQLLRATVVAPARPGCYLLVWDMVQEHTTWFSGQGVAPANVPVRVGAPASDCSLLLEPRAPLAWQPGRPELWRLAVAMWRDHPWTGVGGDNFRRLYGPYAGHSFWDQRVTANNLYLEAAATTGLLGLGALLATLAFTVRCAWRALGRGDGPARAEAATLLALTAAVALHGAVDYVLGFTGPYLLLGFVVGSAAALAREGAGGEAA